MDVSLSDVSDTEVSCAVMEDCILPCSFQGDAEVLTKWIHLTTGIILVHYNKQDHLIPQDQRFRGRTSLFQDQISRGNASLLLTGVKVQDQGRYKCLTWTYNSSTYSFINLKVDAPVRKVSIDQVGNRITCSSNWIYPEPELTWSTSPPSNMKLQNTTTVQQTEQQLYNISSSLILSDSDTDLIYSCTVSTHGNMRRASWRRLKNSANVAATLVPVIVIGATFAVIFIPVMLCKKTKDQPENRTSDRDETSESRDVQDTHEAQTENVPSDSNQQASNIPLIQSDEDSAPG
ncbi:programmed cell death 1 ligand 1-like [Odontesthes bonariensis]|uniref:programmed cell death 1 ligand 1-like n=1 Tax=Odontesthes bonariensis TaxID=219752 RepID=UPI003F589C5C